MCMHAFILTHVDVRCEWLPNHSNYKYQNIQFQFISLSLFLPFINHLHRFILLSCFLYLTSLFHMLTAWLGICWPPGSLNQSRASLTESAHTCPDRNDNDCGQSPPIFTVATVISLFWNDRWPLKRKVIMLQNNCIFKFSISNRSLFLRMSSISI